MSKATTNRVQAVNGSMDVFNKLFLVSLLQLSSWKSALHSQDVTSWTVKSQDSVEDVVFYFHILLANRAFGCPAVISAFSCHKNSQPDTSVLCDCCSQLAIDDILGLCLLVCCSRRLGLVISAVIVLGTPSESTISKPAGHNH